MRILVAVDPSKPDLARRVLEKLIETSDDSSRFQHKVAVTPQASLYRSLSIQQQEQPQPPHSSSIHNSPSTFEDSNYVSSAVSQFHVESQLRSLRDLVAVTVGSDHTDRLGIIVGDTLGASTSLGGVDLLIVLLDQEGSEASADVIRTVEEAIPCLALPDMAALWHPGKRSLSHPSPSPRHHPSFSSIASSPPNSPTSNRNRSNESSGTTQNTDPSYDIPMPSRRSSRLSAFLSRRSNTPQRSQSDSRKSQRRVYEDGSANDLSQEPLTTSSATSLEPAMIVLLGQQKLVTPALRDYLDKVSSISSQAILNAVHKRFATYEKAQSQAVLSSGKYVPWEFTRRYRHTPLWMRRKMENGERILDESLDMEEDKKDFHDEKDDDDVSMVDLCEKEEKHHNDNKTPKNYLKRNAKLSSNGILNNCADLKLNKVQSGRKISRTITNAVSWMSSSSSSSATSPAASVHSDTTTVRGGDLSQPHVRNSNSTANKRTTFHNNDRANVKTKQQQQHHHNHHQQQYSGDSFTKKPQDRFVMPEIRRVRPRRIQTRVVIDHDIERLNDIIDRPFRRKTA